MDCEGEREVRVENIAPNERSDISMTREKKEDLRAMIEHLKGGLSETEQLIKELETYDPPSEDLEGLKATQKYFMEQLEILEAILILEELGV